MTPDERRVQQQWKAALAATDQCLSLEELSGHTERSLADEAESRVSSHLSSCARCQTELAMLQEFEQLVARPDEAAQVSLISAELKRRLATRKIFATRLISTAAMALAAMLLLIAGGLYLRTGKEPVLLSDGSSGQTVFRSQAVTLLEPKGDLERSPTELRWQPVPGAVRYSVKLMEVDRAVLWESSSEETSAALPQPVREKIIPGKTLLWEVTAIEAGGKAVATSPVGRFRVPIKAHP